MVTVRLWRIASQEYAGPEVVYKHTWQIDCNGRSGCRQQWRPARIGKLILPSKVWSGKRRNLLANPRGL